MFTMIYPAILNLVLFPYYDNDLKLKAGVKWLCCCQAVTGELISWGLGLMAGDNGMAKH